MSHTPGPWVAVQYPRSQAWRVTLTPNNARGDIANVLAGLGTISVADDARLIAAAPELLEALKEAQDFLSRHEVAGAITQRVDAAIAKADGTDTVSEVDKHG